MVLGDDYTNNNSDGVEWMLIYMTQQIIIIDKIKMELVKDSQFQAYKLEFCNFILFVIFFCVWKFKED